MSSSSSSNKKFDDENEPLNEDKNEVKKVQTYSSEDVTSAITETFLFTTPIILGLILNCGMEAITLHFLGQKRPDFLASMGTAIMVKALIVVNFIMGSVRAMETMAMEAKADKNLKLMNNIFNKGRMILCVQLFCLISILWRSPLILDQLGQDPYISRNGGTYLAYSAPALISFSHVNYLRRYLAVQGY